MESPNDDPWPTGSILRIYLGGECNKKCADCMPRAGPGQGESTNPEEIGYVLDEMKNFLSICRVSFTGGEPFMMYDLLKNGVGLAAEKGYKEISISTNGSLVNEENLSRLIETAKANGARILLRLSQDEMHGFDSNLKILKNIVDLRKNLDFDMRVLYAKTPLSIQGNEDTIKNFCEANDSTFSGNLQFQTYPYFPEGRGADLYKGPRDIQLDDSKLDKLSCWNNGPIMINEYLLLCNCAPFPQNKNPRENPFAIPLGPNLAERIQNHKYFPLFKEIFHNRGDGKGIVPFLKDLEQAGLNIPKADYLSLYACAICKNMTYEHFDKVLELLKAKA